jgi:GNAT superfamily N-acetyltransferase
MRRWSMRAWPDGMGVDPEILAAWTHAWAISRGKPPPVPVHDGFYLEDGRPQQKARYVFPGVRETVVDALTRAIDEPGIHLKFCAPRAAVAPLLPGNWRIADPGFMMTVDADALASPGAMPRGYASSVVEQGGVVALAVSSDTGAPAARGRLVLRGALAIFDQVETEEEHRRRGLGTAVMRELGRQAALRGAERGILVATPAGRALYLSLGWQVLSDYTSTCIPG